MGTWYCEGAWGRGSGLPVPMSYIFFSHRLQYLQTERLLSASKSLMKFRWEKAPWSKGLCLSGNSLGTKVWYNTSTLILFQYQRKRWNIYAMKVFFVWLVWFLFFNLGLYQDLWTFRKYFSHHAWVFHPISFSFTGH